MWSSLNFVKLEDTIYDHHNLVAGAVISKVGDFGESEVEDFYQARDLLRRCPYHNR